MIGIGHTLRDDLMRTMLKWSGILFVLLALLFFLGYDRLANLMLADEARYLLDYQGAEFGKHLLRQEMKEIDEESMSLVATGEISGVAVLTADNQILDAVFDKDLMPNATFGPKSGLASMERVLREHPELAVFKKQIPKTNDVLWIVMDRRPMLTAIFTSTASITFLLVALLIIAIASLNFTLRRRLVAPVEEVQRFLDEDQPAAQSALQKLETSLPKEAMNILHVYEQLKTSHEGLRSHLSQMLDIVPSCLWWADGHGRYQQLSERATKLFGAAPQQLIGKSMWDWMSDQEQAQANRKRIERAMHEHTQHVHLSFSDPSSPEAEARWFDEQVSIRYDDHGKAIGLYGICSDVSERHQQEQLIKTHVEQIRRMETVGTLVGGIAHEFNNMLAGIVGNVFLLRQNLPADPDTTERLDHLDHLIRRAASMIEELLTFGRKSQARGKNFALRPHLEEILHILQSSLKSGAKIDTDIRSDAALVADRTQIQQAITHLIDNADYALRDTPEPMITVTLEDVDADEDFLTRHPEVATPRLLRLAVTDNGCGIDPAIIGRIFDPFFTTREVGEGTGLGLSMVYGMVHQLGGAIEVESQPGQGATFRLYMPRAEPISIEEDVSGEISYGQGETILLVEDEPVMRKIAIEVLEKLGYRTVEAIDGQDALRRFEQQRQDIRLLMIDLIMPIMGGAKVAAIIRKEIPDMPVLFMTAHDLTNSLGPELNLPRSDLIAKPFAIAALSTTLRRLLEEQESDS